MGEMSIDILHMEDVYRGNVQICFVHDEPVQRNCAEPCCLWRTSIEKMIRTLLFVKHQYRENGQSGLDCEGPT